MTANLQARLAKLNSYLRMEGVETLDQWDRGYYAAVKEEARFLRSILNDITYNVGLNVERVYNSKNKVGSNDYQTACESSPTFNQELDSGLHQ